MTQLTTKTAQRLREIKNLVDKYSNIFKIEYMEVDTKQDAINELNILIKEIINFKNELKEIIKQPYSEDIVNNIYVLIQEIESVEKQ